MTDKITELAIQYESRLEEALITAFISVEDLLNEEVVKRALESNNEILATTLLGDPQSDSSPLENALSESKQGSFADIITALFISAAIVASNQIKFDFETQNRRISESTLNEIERITKRITNDAEQSVKQAIRSGQTPTEIKKSLRLSPQQQIQLDRFKDALKEAQQVQKTLTVKIRTNRTSRIVYQYPDIKEVLKETNLRGLNAGQKQAIRKAIGKQLTDQDITKIINRQRTAMINHRIKTIAKTEAQQIANAGEQAAWEQAQSKGHLTNVKRFWVDANDERVRQDHKAVSRLNPTGVEIKEPFKTPLGSIMHPPLEINCRCRVQLKKVTDNG